MLMVMTRTLTSLCAFFFLRSVTAAVSEDEPRDCSSADQSSCRAVPSWTQAAASEDEGLELLQFKGSEKTKKICPVPNMTQYAPLAKYCPKTLPGDKKEEFSSCLEENRHFTQFANAWEKCGLLADCGAVMLWSDGNYYLRRATDPDSHVVVANVKLWNYDCQASKQEAKALEKMAEDKAQEIVKKERRKLNEKEQAEAHAIKGHLEAELQEIKDEASRVEEEEQKFVTETELKASALHERAHNLADTTAKVTQDATQARNRLDKANKVEAQAEYLVFHDEGLKMTKEEAAKKVAEEQTQIEATNAQFKEISNEATSLSKQIKEIQAHMDAVKNDDEKKIAQAKVKTWAANEKKDKLVTELHDLSLKRADVEEKLNAKKQKLKEGQAELNDMEEQMKEA
mmetsp:Transcript_147496/g.260091  ORF Transcript_147496/g.260091 Transcript_147496/m.260091 type:complete len:399 (-) Transcript_147496:162-1358(-)